MTSSQANHLSEINTELSTVTTVTRECVTYRKYLIPSENDKNKNTENKEREGIAKPRGVGNHRNINGISTNSRKVSNWIKR